MVFNYIDNDKTMNDILKKKLDVTLKEQKLATQGAVAASAVATAAVAALFQVS